MDHEQAIEPGSVWCTHNGLKVMVGIVTGDMVRAAMYRRGFARAMRFGVSHLTSTADPDPFGLHTWGNWKGDL